MWTSNISESMKHTPLEVMNILSEKFFVRVSVNENFPLDAEIGGGVFHYDGPSDRSTDHCPMLFVRRRSDSPSLY